MSDMSWFEKMQRMPWQRRGLTYVFSCYYTLSSTICYFLDFE